MLRKLSHVIARSFDTPRAIFAARTSVFLLTVIALAGCALAGAWLAAQPQWPAWLNLAMFLLAILSGLLVAQFLYRIDADLAQWRRDLRAADVFRRVQRGEPASFCLYLRPFASTDALETYIAQPILGGGRSGMVATERLEFETQLERAARSIGPLVALGQPLEHEGAGRIRVRDDEWQDAIHVLMDAARLIVLLPAAQPGTLWEVRELLARGHIGKTVIIDPPNTGSARADYDPAARWQDVRLAFARAGHALPDDDTNGLIVYFGARHKSPSAIRALRLDAVPVMRSFLMSALHAA